MTSRGRSRQHALDHESRWSGSRTAGYLLCIALATPLLFLAFAMFLGWTGALAVVATVDAIALAWALREHERQRATS